MRKGRVEVNLYKSSKEFLTKRVLEAGDLILLCGGGHSLKMLEETSMIEIKQGPYAGDNDKTRFKGEREDYEGVAVKVAATATLLSMVTSQTWPALMHTPDHPTKAEVLVGIAVRVTTVPFAMAFSV